MQQRIEPALRDDRVGIKEHDVRARKLHAAIRRAGEANVVLVSQQHELRMRQALELGEILGNARIGRRVVDQHYAHVGAQMRQHARYAGPDIRRRVVHRHDDVDGDAARDDRHPPRTRFHHSRMRSHGSEIHQRTLWR